MQHEYEYTYSARHHEEVKAIRDKYLPREQDALERMKQLDRNVSRRALGRSLALGISMALLFGSGLNCCLVWTDRLLVPGIVFGLVGLLGSLLAFPFYRRQLERERARTAPEILRLSKEILG